MRTRLRYRRFLLGAALVGLGAACTSTDPGQGGPGQVDLAITKTADRDSAPAGTSVSFTITVTNLGPITATGVTGGDTLPTGMTYVSSSVTAGTYSSTTGIWAIGSLAQNGAATLTLNATMASGTAGTWRVNRAGVLASETDSVIGNNIAADSVKLAATAASGADLAVALTADRGGAPAGSPVVFTVNVTNHGPTAATNVNGRDSLPAGLTYVSSSTTGGTYSSSTGTWAIGSLPKDSSRTLTLNATMGSGTPGTWRVNRASVTATETDGVLGNNAAADSVVLIAPTAGSDSEPADPGSGYLWADNFDRYASVLNMQWSSSYCGSAHPDADSTYGQHTWADNDLACTLKYGTNMSLTQGRGGSGQALRATIVTSSGNQQAPWLTPHHPNTWGSFSPALVIQVWVRISAGGTPGTAGMKFMEAWNSSARGQWGPDRGTQARPLFHYAYSARSNVDRTPQSIGPYWDQINEGNWHRMTFLWRPNTTSTFVHTGGTTSANETYTGTSSRDGRMAMWIDGVLMLDYQQSKVGVTPSGGTSVWCYQSDVDFLPTPDLNPVYAKFPDVVNASPMDWTIDHDDLKVWAIP